jgi:hypothetical protein
MRREREEAAQLNAIAEMRRLRHEDEEIAAQALADMRRDYGALNAIMELRRRLATRYG